MTTHLDDTQGLDAIFSKSPIDKEVPDDIWGTIYATWTGLWTDGYGEWDEKQPSDIYPISELLSNEAQERLKQAILHWVNMEIVGDDEVEDIDLSKSAKSRWGVRARNRVRDSQRQTLIHHGYKQNTKEVK